MAQLSMQPGPDLQPTRSDALPAIGPNALVKVGAVSYLNTKPLIYGLDADIAHRGVLSLDLPSKLARDLSGGELDIGLIPVVEYFQNSDFRIVSDAVIACKGPVWSVRIFFRREPSQVQTLALDEGSKTSVALSKVLFHRRFGFVPNTIPLKMMEDPLASPADAVLVIGDRAMHPENYRGRFQSDWDLGQVWLEETGLPFVFAMWVARNQSYNSQEWKSVLESARDQGIRNVSSIAQRVSPNYQLSPQQCEDYLTNYIRFYLRDDELAGLHEFRRQCVALNLVSN